MIVTIHQPEYLPWLGFCDKAINVDLFVLLDSVQFRKNYFQNRNRIRSATGPIWLSVPVSLKDGHKQPIKDIRINNREARAWRVKTWKSIVQCYRRAPYFEDYAPFFESLYSQDWDLLVDLNCSVIDYVFESLGSKAKRIRSSDLGIHQSKTDLLVEICREVGATSYISGISGKDYLEMDKFSECGIELRFQEFYHPVYKQLYQPFVPCMSVIDLLFNCGPASPDVIKGIGVSKLDYLFE